MGQLCLPHDSLLHARLADLICTDPFTLNGPCAEALVIWVVPGEVAVLDQTAAGMTALEVDDFILYFGQLPSADFISRYERTDLTHGARRRCWPRSPNVYLQLICSPDLACMSANLRCDGGCATDLRSQWQQQESGCTVSPPKTEQCQSKKTTQPFKLCNDGEDGSCRI